MSILPICITGEPVLHRVAAPIDSFDSELSDLVADMIETMHAAPGVGLAAPQVGVGSQIFVWRYAGGGAFDSNPAHPPRCHLRVGGVPLRARVRLPAASRARCCPTRIRRVRRAHRGHCSRLARAHLPARIRPPARNPLRRPPRTTLRGRSRAGHSRARVGTQRIYVDPGGVSLTHILPGPPRLGRWGSVDLETE